MARYEHLPIYRQAFAVALHFEQVVAGFSRYHKYTLGTELRQASRTVVTAMVSANSAGDKAPQLLALRAQLDELLLLMRLAKEAKAFRSFAAYTHAWNFNTNDGNQNNDNKNNEFYAWAVRPGG